METQTLINMLREQINKNGALLIELMEAVVPDEEIQKAKVEALVHYNMILAAQIEDLESWSANESTARQK